MSSADLPRDLVSCETSLSEHNDARTEIRGKHDKFADAEKVGDKLISERNYNAEEIKKCLQKLEKMEDEVSSSWEARRALLAQCMELHIFKKNCDLVEASLLAKKKQIRDDLGDSVATVDEMIAEHETFQRHVEAQRERVAGIETQADDLCSRGHYDSSGIQQRKSVVQSKWDELLDAMSLRRRTLKASLDYQQFISKANEVSKWIEFKTHTAKDPNWREPTNLQKKTQAHQTFETELKANEGRVLDVMNEGKKLVEENHYRKEDIQAKAAEVEKQWSALNAASAEKKNKLAEATEALLFNLSMDDIEIRIQSIETQLASGDHGSDLPSAVKLLEKHQSLHQELATLEVKVKEMSNTAQRMADNKHFLKDELSVRSRALEGRYKALEGPWMIRKTNLDDTVALYKFNNEVADELDFFAEKSAILENHNFGASVSEVQSLQRKHEELTQEVRGHEPEVETVSNEAYRMLQQNHFAASDIKVKLDGVIEAQKNVNDDVEKRRIALDESLAAQEYYAKNAEAQQWLRDRQPGLTSKDLGRNEDSAAKLLKKLEEVGRNVDNFGKTVAHLDKQKKTLLDQKNSYGQGIKSAKATLDALFKECKGQAATRREDLKNSQEWFAFQRSSTDVSEWMLEKSQVALSEEYGRDLEHVDLLIQSFNDFQHNLANSESKVNVVTAKGYEICERGHPRSSEISARCWELSQQWTELRETANERAQALESARQVHKFDDDADDVIGWISGKDSDLSSLGVGTDLPSVLSNIAKNEEFERELAAASERVEAVRHEASRLLAAFPDTQAHINEKVAALNNTWDKLMATADKRKTNLTQARELMKYLNNHKDLSRWCKEKSLELDVDEPVHDLAGAEALIERFADKKKEILGHADEIKACEKRGLALASEGGLMAEADIEEKVEKLGKEYEELLAKLEAKAKQLFSKKDLQGVARELDALESWLAARQGDVDSADYGESIDQTEDMLKKHDDFKQMLTAQEDKVTNLGKDPSLAQAKQIEAKKDRDAKEKVEKQRLDELKKKEKEKLLEARDDGMEKPAPKTSADNVPRPRPQSLAAGMKEDSPSPDPKAKAAAEALKRSASSVALANKPIIPKVVKEEGYSSDEDDAATMPPPQTGPTSSKPTLDIPAPQPLSLTMKPRKTPSFRSSRLPELPSSLPPPTVEGLIERKHTQQVGGKKAAIRSWNNYYAALCGNLLIFFKDKKSRDEMRLTSSMPPPLNVEDAAVRPANDYKGRKNVFELKAPDGAEFLFDVSTPKERDDWVNAIGRAAGPPGIDVAFSGDRASLNSDHDGENSHPPDAPIAAPPLSPRETLAVNSRDGDNLSMHSNESDSGVSGNLTGDVTLRASTLPAGANRVSTLSAEGDEGKKKKKGFGSFLKKKKDKS